LKYLLLFIPYLVSLLFSEDPDTAYSIAWLGSFWIFWLSISGRIKPLPKDLSLGDQFMRPVVLTQLVFAGYMAVTSIFYFLDLHGYTYFDLNTNVSLDLTKIKMVSRCQQYYVLAHACMVTGMLFIGGRTKKQYSVIRFDPQFLLILSGLFFVLAFVSRFVPGMGQLFVRFQNISFIASIIAFTVSIRNRNTFYIFIGAALFAFNMVGAFLSGWKESVLVPVIILSVLLYPSYKKLVMLTAAPVFIFLLYFLPSYNQIVRTQSWYQGVKAGDAAEDALAQLETGQIDIKETNWEFLTLRLSDVNAFTRFMQRIPSVRDFYGFEIVVQALGGLVPRIFYPEKPNVETLVMERVYQSGLVTRESLVSAKPHVVIDAYLSGAGLGVVVTFITYGLLAAIASREAEKLFGGYLPGTALIYTGLFQIFWRGNCFEFLVNAVFWSFVLMYFLFWIGRRAGYIVRVR
jgi:hypothetical protein